MIIWNQDDPYGPCGEDRCTMCRGRLRAPLVVWHPSCRGEDEDNYQGYGRFICGECCGDMCQGLSIDMKRIVTAKKVERLGFRHAAKRAAVSGGFLMSGTDNKQ